MAFEQGFAFFGVKFAATGLLKKAKMSCLCTELQAEESRMLLEEVHGLQLIPTKILCPNRQTAGTTATGMSQICPLNCTSHSQLAFTHKKLKAKPSWEDRVLALSKWKNLAGHPAGSVFQKGDLEFL